MPTTEIFVSKLSFRDDEQLIRDVFAYEYDGHSLSSGEIRLRHWLVNRAESQMPISVLDKDAEGDWVRKNSFTYNGSIFTWGMTLPQNTPRRKVFVSYYHHDDQEYRELFEKVVQDLIVSKSLEDGDIDSDNGDEYVKQLIQQEYLHDTILLVVLIGPNTLHRKHVDWEISGALNYKVGGRYAGLCGLLLPTHPDYGGQNYYYSKVPMRLAENAKTGYAAVRNWTTDRCALQTFFEDAINRRSDTSKIVNARIPQMKEDTNS